MLPGFQASLRDAIPLIRAYPPVELVGYFQESPSTSSGQALRDSCHWYPRLLFQDLHRSRLSFQDSWRSWSRLSTRRGLGRLRLVALTCGRLRG